MSSQTTMFRLRQMPPSSNTPQFCSSQYIPLGHGTFRSPPHSMTAESGKLDRSGGLAKSGETAASIVGALTIGTIGPGSFGIGASFLPMGRESHPRKSKQATTRSFEVVFMRRR